MRLKWRKALPLFLAVIFVAFVVAYGPTLAGRAAYAVAVGEARAARGQLAELSRHDRLSALFRGVAKAVKPAVVVVHVKQKVEMRSPQMDLDDFFRRFFGDDVPRRSIPRSPAPKREFFFRGLGSGVIVNAEKGYILTNWHVVRNAHEVEVVLSDSRRLTAEWVRTDAPTDLAIIKVKPDRLIDAPLGDSDKMDVGDWVLAIGAPEGLPQTVTAGIISAKGRTTGRGESYQDFLQTDAAINHGNSGGPLVNMRGEVIGVNSAIISRTGVNEGIGLSVPSNMVKSIMTQLIEKGKVVRGYLGVQIQDIGEKLAKSFNLPNMEGALVTQVAKDGPAEKAGMKSGDFIVKVNGKRVKNINELRNAVAALSPGKGYPFEVFRDGKKKTLTVRMAVQPEDMAAAFGGEEQPGTASAARYGIEVASITKELAAKYGLKEPIQGVVIVEVDPDSDAADQGLAEGMVILQVQGRNVTSPGEFSRILSGKGAANGVRLLITDKSGGKRFLFVSPKK
jgi:serine protease Do